PQRRLQATRTDGGAERRRLRHRRSREDRLPELVACAESYLGGVTVTTPIQIAARECRVTLSARPQHARPLLNDARPSTHRVHQTPCAPRPVRTRARPAD